MRTEIKNDGEAFDYDELVIVDAQYEGDWNCEEHGGESWANVLCAAALRACAKLDLPDLYAPDYDCTSLGLDGIAVLIPLESVDAWLKAANELDISLEVAAQKPQAGRWGDGGWEGIVLADDDNGLWWLE